MQKIIVYVAANATLGTVRDYLNAQGAAAPTLTLGVECALKLRLFANAQGMEPYPLSELQRAVSWQWVMDNDFNSATPVKFQADAGAITISEVTVDADEEDDGDAGEYTYTEVYIPISAMATEEAVAMLGAAESVGGITGELCGYDADSKAIFVLQVKGFTLRNRLVGVGDPTELDPEYLTASQVRSLIAAGVALQYSADGTNWHGTQAATDRYLRFRSASDASAAWSDGIALLPGPKGDAGLSAYQVWLAAGNSGTEADFLASLAAGGAPDLSGYATSAALNEEAAARDAADSLLATAISGKAPSSHDHSIADVANLQNVLDAKIPSSAKGVPNGIATLGAAGKIPVEQLPEQAVGVSMPPATITLPIPCDDEDDNLILVVEFSATGTFDEDPPLRVSMEDDYAKMKVFSSGVWRTLDAGSVGVPDYGGSVAFQLDSTLLPGYAAGTRYYARYCWVDSRGGTDGWIGFAFAGDVADMRPVRTMEDEPAPVVHDLGGVSGALSLDYQDGEIQTATLSGNATLASSGIANLPPGGALLAYVTVTSGNALTVGNASFTKAGATYQVAATNFGQIRMAVSELI